MKKCQQAKKKLIKSVYNFENEKELTPNIVLPGFTFSQKSRREKVFFFSFSPTFLAHIFLLCFSLSLYNNTSYIKKRERENFFLLAHIAHKIIIIIIIIISIFIIYI